MSLFSWLASRSYPRALERVARRIDGDRDPDGDFLVAIKEVDFQLSGRSLQQVIEAATADLRQRGLRVSDIRRDPEGGRYWISGSVTPRGEEWLAELRGQPQGATATGLRVALLAVLSVLLLASVAAVAYLGATRPVPALGIDGDQDALQSQRESVMRQAEQFMLRINTYGPDLLDGDTMPKYRELVEEVITPKFAADFEKNAPLAEATVKQAGVGRTAKVFSTGVSAIDSDSATALVAGSITQTYPSSPGASDRVETDPAPFRVQVTLVKVKGTWRVDDFSPLTGTDDSGTGTGTELPTPTEVPTEGATPSEGASP